MLTTLIMELKDGSGGFTAVRGKAMGSEGDNTYSVIVGDVEGGGGLDLVAGNYNRTNKLYLNNGSGGFAASGAATASDTADTDSVVLGDVDAEHDGVAEAGVMYTADRRAVYETSAGYVLRLSALTGHMKC